MNQQRVIASMEVLKKQFPPNIRLSLVGRNLEGGEPLLISQDEPEEIIKALVRMLNPLTNEIVNSEGIPITDAGYEPPRIIVP